MGWRENLCDDAEVKYLLARYASKPGKIGFVRKFWLCKINVADFSAQFQLIVLWLTRNSLFMNCTSRALELVIPVLYVFVCITFEIICLNMLCSSEPTLKLINVFTSCSPNSKVRRKIMERSGANLAILKSWITGQPGC